MAIASPCVGCVMPTMTAAITLMKKAVLTQPATPRSSSVTLHAVYQKTGAVTVTWTARMRAMNSTAPITLQEAMLVQRATLPAPTASVSIPPGNVMVTRTALMAQMKLVVSSPTFCYTIS